MIAQRNIDRAIWAFHHSMRTMFARIAFVWDEAYRIFIRTILVQIAKPPESDAIICADSVGIQHIAEKAEALRRANWCSKRLDFYGFSCPRRSIIVATDSRNPCKHERTILRRNQCAALAVECHGNPTALVRLCACKKLSGKSQRKRQT